MPVGGLWLSSYFVFIYLSCSKSKPTSEFAVIADTTCIQQMPTWKMSKEPTKTLWHLSWLRANGKTIDWAKPSSNESFEQQLWCTYWKHLLTVLISCQFSNLRSLISNASTLHSILKTGLTNDADPASAPWWTMEVISLPSTWTESRKIQGPHKVFLELVINRKVNEDKFQQKLVENVPDSPENIFMRIHSRNGLSRYDMTFSMTAIHMS